MNNKKLENSVRSLINLYTVVIGAALSLAVARAIDVKAGLASLSMVSVLLFLCFVVTLFPFFHGALRHLDDAYVENVNSHIKTGALIIDFALLFLHALAFVVLSQLLQHPSHFAWFLIAVLTIDVIWGIFAHFGSSSIGSLSSASRWTIINIAFIAAVCLYLVINDIYLEYSLEPLKLAVLLAIACILRSTIDYVWCREFYFPKSGQIEK